MKIIVKPKPRHLLAFCNVCSENGCGEKACSAVCQHNCFSVCLVDALPGE